MADLGEESCGGGQPQEQTGTGVTLAEEESTAITQIKDVGSANFSVSCIAAKLSTYVAKSVFRMLKI